MPGMKGTMKEYKAGKLHSGSKKGPKVTSKKQAVAIGLSQERKEKAHNTRLDAGMKGERYTHPDMQTVPDEEMHSAKNAPHKMGQHEMYPPANLKGNLAPVIEHHMKQAASYAGTSEHARTMREHHEGMARALRAQLHPNPHRGPEYP